MIKRGSIVDQGEERRKLLSQVEQLIVSGELRKVCSKHGFSDRGYTLIPNFSFSIIANAWM